MRGEGHIFNLCLLPGENINLKDKILSKSNRGYKSEKRRKELERQKKKEEKLAKRLDKSGSDESVAGSVLEEQKLEAES